MSIFSNGMGTPIINNRSLYLFILIRNVHSFVKIVHKLGLHLFSCLPLISKSTLLIRLFWINTVLPSKGHLGYQNALQENIRGIIGFLEVAKTGGGNL